MISRRDWIATVAGGAALGLLGRTASAQSASWTGAPVPIQVFKSPTCGCCGKWVSHLEAQGFAVSVEDVPDVGAIKKREGVPAELGSCHTGLVEGYVIEGHVPAEDIHRLLRERPALRGIAVPGMPVGSPGMEMGGRKDAYEVVAFDRAGKRWTFARH